MWCNAHSLKKSNRLAISISPQSLDQDNPLAIEFCNGSVVQAAKLLGIGKTTLYRKQQNWKPIKSSL
ncbi:MAG TPA: hypothetical protein EYP59_17130 [Thiotrichaceae bacterium]|nr:hypothetical protein [Thiotrichaceae bacterium]